MIRITPPPRAATALFVAALLAAVTLGWRSARADAIGDEADFRFNHAAGLLKQGKIEEALAEFFASNRLVRNRNVIFNIARCFEVLRQPDEAHRFYSEILGDEMPAADRRSLNAALERLRPSLALLEVKTEPPGADVFVNRRDLGARGQTPLLLALKPGKETALVELPGYRTFKTEVVLTIGKTVTVEAALERIYGSIEASGSPDNFELRVDEAAGPALVGAGSARALPGSRKVIVTAPGFQPYETRVEVPPDGSVRIPPFKLLPVPVPSGRLVVKANLDGAQIKVDGKVLGFTPHAEDVPAGIRRVEITADGREPIVQLIEVKHRQEFNLEVRLRYAQPRVVAAERKLTRAEDAPASITVISGEELRAFGYATLAEALRGVRGFYLSNDREYEAVGERGFATASSYNSRVLVLNDGHVTNEISYGQGAIGRDFDADLSEVERIEIVRGPGSVLYGSAAFFGVVNVVHRVPPPGLHLRASGTLGSLGEETGHLSGSVGDDQRYLWLRGSATNLKNDQFFAVPASATPDGIARVGQDVDGELAVHGDLRARWSDFSLAGTYNYRKKDLPTGAYRTYPGVSGTNLLDRRSFIEGSFNHAFESGLGIEARVSYDAYRYKANWNYDPEGPGVDTTAADWLTVEGRIRVPEVFHNKLLVGAEVQDRYNVHITSYVPGKPGFDNGPGLGSGAPNSETIYSVYAGDEITLHKRASLNLAARLDTWPSFGGPVFNPRAVAILHLYDEGTTKLIYGRAFRGPGFAERYYTDYTTTQANPDLSPERITTYELEHTHQLTDEVSVMATGFYSRISQLIRNVDLVDGPFAGQVQLQNQSGITTSVGAEAEARWQPTSGTLLSFWFAWSRVRDPVGNPVPNSPEQSGAVRYMYPLVSSVLAFSTEVIYGGPRRTVDDPPNPVALVGESIRWNAGITGMYSKLNLRYGLYAQNILDERISVSAGPEVPLPNHATPQYGRVLRLQLAGTF